MRRTHNETDSPDYLNENANAKSKGCAKCFPFVNYWARSVLDLTSMYVSAIDIITCILVSDYLEVVFFKPFFTNVNFSSSDFIF